MQSIYQSQFGSLSLCIMPKLADLPSCTNVWFLGVDGELGRPLGARIKAGFQDCQREAHPCARHPSNTQTKVSAPLDSFNFGRLELQRRFGAGADMQFVVNMPKMPPDGPIVHSHPAGNFLVGKALGQQFENLVFSRR